MLLIHAKSPVLWLGAAALLVVASTLSSFSGGVQSGTGNVPANCSMQLPACSGCHSGSAPFAGRLNPPVATLTVAKRALNFNEAIAVTTAINGIVPSNTGGFVCEATSGAFTVGTNSRIVTNTASITHLNSASRSWSYTFTAPNAVGPVSLTSCAMTADSSSGTSGDAISFAAFNANALVATPVRLFVLPAGVTNVGSACADGFGNQSVLGANSTPTVNNPGFAFQLLGAAPAALAVVWAGINPPGFTPVNLGAMFGLTGCTGYLANIMQSVTATTSSGSAERAEGTASFPLGIPNSAVLQGQVFNVQGGYVDMSVAATRSMPLSFSNGLRVVIQ